MINIIQIKITHTSSQLFLIDKEEREEMELYPFTEITEPL